MTFVFGTKSKLMLAQVHPDLCKLMDYALEHGTQDFSVICGHRGKAAQEAAFKAGNTKVHYPNSAHNGLPAKAVDVLPYPFTNYEDLEMHKAWFRIHDAVKLASKTLHIPYRWGGGVPDKAFNWDLPHFELHPWRSYK